jgi:hypothetical protein
MLDLTTSPGGEAKRRSSRSSSLLLLFIRLLVGLAGQDDGESETSLPARWRLRGRTTSGDVSGDPVALKRWT